MDGSSENTTLTSFNCMAAHETTQYPKNMSLLDCLKKINVKYCWVIQSVLIREISFHNIIPQYDPGTQFHRSSTPLAESSTYHKSLADSFPYQSKQLYSTVMLHVC